MSAPKSGIVRGGSFPSGHAANNFAIATVLALFYRFGWLYFFAAVFVSYSQVCVGSHYSFDGHVIVEDATHDCVPALRSRQPASW